MKIDGWGQGGINDAVQATVRKAVAAERRRCAKIAAEWKSPLRPGTEARLLGHQEAARDIAAAIRKPPRTVKRGM